MKDVVRLFLFCFAALGPYGVEAQELLVKKASGDIVLDGVPDESAWVSAGKATGFRQYFPSDSVAAQGLSTVMITRDDRFLYLAFKVESLEPRAYVTNSLRRDFRGLATDGMTAVFDTFSDGTNAFFFGITPFGVQREGLISNGGSLTDDFNLSWDNKWFSEVKIFDTYWTAELAIPFNSLRFKDDSKVWKVNFYRIDSKNAERSTWVPIPQVYPIYNLAFTRDMVWEEAPGSSTRSVSVIPFTAGSVDKYFDENLPQQESLDLGMDAKIGLGPGLNLDLTVLPDFSQVEVDQQVTNLDRFEIFFPERRQFFLENADLFAEFGTSGIRPFFSRRIGVAVDTATGQNFQLPIYFGARLSGKLTNQTRLGVLSMQTGSDVRAGLQPATYSVIALQQKVFSRSNIGLIFVNRQNWDDSLATPYFVKPAEYNRAIGLDFNFSSKDNRLRSKLFVQHSSQASNPDSTWAYGARAAYEVLPFSIAFNYSTVGNNYNPETGFVQRTGYERLSHESWLNFYPERSGVQRHGPGFDFDMIWNKADGFLDWDYNFQYRIQWRNTASFSMRLRRQYTYLFDPFDPSGTEGPELAAGAGYTANLLVASFESDQRQNFTFFASTRTGAYFNGSRFQWEGGFAYRFQPYALVSLDYEYNRIRLPAPYHDADLVLLGPRFDITFNRSLFWTSFFQYNSQIENLNINSRLQWRFAPVSDLFMVYTDNYLASPGGVDFNAPKSRALVMKLTYWFNP